MKLLIPIVIGLFLSACTATGPTFSGLEKPANDNTSIYVMRQSALAGAAYCPPVTLDGQKIGCLKNAGFFHSFIKPGKHELRFEKRFGEVGEERFVKFTIKEGQTLFFEWVTSANEVYFLGTKFAGMSFSEGIIPHKEESALILLAKLKRS